MTENAKVYMPFGWMAGKEIDLPFALSNLSMELMGVISDGAEPLNRRTEVEKREALTWHIERVAFSLSVIAWQLDPQRTTGYTEQAARLGVTLPPGFTEDTGKTRE